MSTPESAWEPLTLEELQRLLPQYEITGFLGRGGMGAVYKGRQPKLDRDVAIKVLPEVFTREDDERHYAERFLREAQAMARLDHPAILAVYDFGETSEGLLYIVMEFIDGVDIQQYLRHHEGTLPVEHALAITAHVLDGLDYAHGQGIVHRDIKPANVLLNREGRVKIADFGLAKQFGEGPEAVDPSLTMSGMAFGTRDFIAPEALEVGQKVDHRADLYAVGVMLYQMLTGKLPRGKFQAVSEICPGLDPRLEKVALKAMEADPDQRYGSAAAMRADLDAILSEPLARAEAKMSSGQAPRAVPEMRSTSLGRVRRGERSVPQWERRAGGKRPSRIANMGGIGLVAALVIGMGLGWFWWSARKERELAQVSDSQAKTSEEAFVSPQAESPATVAKVEPESQPETRSAELVPTKPESEPNPVSKSKAPVTEIAMVESQPEPAMSSEPSTTGTKQAPETSPANLLETIPGLRKRLETYWRIGSEQIEELAASYTRGIETRLGRAADAGDLRLAKAWNEEKQRVEALRKTFAEPPVPAVIGGAESVTFPELTELPEGSPAEVATLRRMWMTEQDRIRADLSGKLQQSLDVLEAELHKAQDFQNAKTVIAFRERLGAELGRSTATASSMPPSGAPDVQGSPKEMRGFDTVQDHAKADASARTFRDSIDRFLSNALYDLRQVTVRGSDGKFEFEIEYNKAVPPGGHVTLYLDIDRDQATGTRFWGDIGSDVKIQYLMNSDEVSVLRSDQKDKRPIPYEVSQKREGNKKLRILLENVDFQEFDFVVQSNTNAANSYPKAEKYRYQFENPVNVDGNDREWTAVDFFWKNPDSESLGALTIKDVKISHDENHIFVYANLMKDMEFDEQDDVENDNPPDDRKEMRQQIAAPILMEFKEWIDETARDPFLKEATRRALTYVKNQWVALNRYLEDGRLPISNIHTERAMRGVGIGRKNWLFVGSEAGGKHLATILSLVTTCRNLQINTLAYFTDVLARVNTHPQSRLHELLPDRWRDIQIEAGRNVVRTKRPEWREEGELDLMVA